jgi:hypothetical protein
MSEQYVIKKITTMYPKLDKTYRFDAEQQRSVSCSPLDDGAEYSVNFIMDGPTAKELWAYMKETYNAEKKKNWPEIKNPFKKTEDGMWSHKANLKGAYNGEKTRKPSQVDSKVQALPDDFQLTSGSTANVAVKGVPYNGSMGCGCSLRLQAVQVLKLAERPQASPFGAEEGFDSQESSPFTAVDQNEIEAPASKKSNNVLEDTPVKEPKVKKKEEVQTSNDDLSDLVDAWDDADE